VRSAAVAALALVVLTLALAPPASAKVVKAFWGPPTGFSNYRELGVGVYQMVLNWNQVAAIRRPSNARNPSDTAYQWPASIDAALAQANSAHIQILLMPIYTPGWANGGRQYMWAPKKVKDYADFVYAASKRYPKVRLWMIWGEPSRQPNFQPLTPQPDSRAAAGKPLTKGEAQGPRIYASMLDAAYGALKSLTTKNLVIGGNTFSWGAQGIRPVQYVENMRFGSKNARPRLDFYGHNPFTSRKPDLSNKPFCFDQQGKRSQKAGCADFSDLKWFNKVVDKNLGSKKHPHLPLFLSEFTIPTAPHDSEFPFYVTPPDQAKWITAGFAVSRSVGAYAFGWVHLQDDPPQTYVRTITGGLIYSDGIKKPGYAAFRKG
jgi:hypothetical protein